MLKAKLLGATAAAQALAIEDVFSTYLYTGNGSTQTITNGIDLAGEGGLVWFKNRDTVDIHALFDSARSLTDYLRTNGTNAAGSATTNLTFTSSGLSFNNSYGLMNNTGDDYASWTFRKAPRFFDVVTYTGTGGSRTVAHNLGTTVGCLIVKRTDTAQNWYVYHRGVNFGATQFPLLLLNTTAAASANKELINSTEPTSTEFSVASDLNTSGGTYVAYLFAHDPLGPSGDGSDGLIACGSFNTGGSGTGSVTLGWEPQFCILKASSTTGNWDMADIMRGASVNTTNNRQYLLANSSVAEAASEGFYPTATGFVYQGLPTSTTYIYIAIRRGPMREPTVGTEVFAPVLGDATPPAFNTTFPIDLNVYKWRTSAAGSIWSDRLRGAQSLNSSNTNAEFANSLAEFDYMNGFGDSTVFTSDYVGWNFRRAPGFFDVVAYTGNGVAGRTVPHNLGVAPEMMIVKCRSAAYDWIVWHEGLSGNTYDLVLNTTAAEANFDLFSSTAPDASNFYLGTNYFDYHNASTRTYIAYLFATLPGVSKVGSYTGNGSNQTINCGFTGGARFVLIKRTDNTGDWYVWDTARGIVAGNDPHLSLNTTAAEVTTNDSIDPDSSGFIVNQLAATNINVSSASYIYFAVS